MQVYVDQVTPNKTKSQNIIIFIRYICILQTKQVVIVIDKYKYIVVIYCKVGYDIKRVRENMYDETGKLKPRNTVIYSSKLR